MKRFYTRQARSEFKEHFPNFAFDFFPENTTLELINLQNGVGVVAYNHETDWQDRQNHETYKDSKSTCLMLWNDSIGEWVREGECITYSRISLYGR